MNDVVFVEMHEALEQGSKCIDEFFLVELFTMAGSTSSTDLLLQIRLLFYVYHSFTEQMPSKQSVVGDVGMLAGVLQGIKVAVDQPGLVVSKQDLLSLELYQGKHFFIYKAHLIFIYNIITCICPEKKIVKNITYRKQIQNNVNDIDMLSIIQSISFRVQPYCIMPFIYLFIYRLIFVAFLDVKDIPEVFSWVLLFIEMYMFTNQINYPPFDIKIIKIIRKRMNFQLDSVIEVLLSNDNLRRIEAQKFVDEIPLNYFEHGIDAFMMSMSHQNSNIASMGALLLKKKYLDPKENIQKIPQEKLISIITNVKNSMNPNRSIMFLKRCCEILVRIYSYANIKDELIDIIEQLNNVETNNMKISLMYFIEIVCECAFNDELLIKYSKNLENIFAKGLNDPSNDVKVASFKTLTIFLSSISDEKMMKNFAGVLKVLISKTIELIKFDQQSGTIALQSLNELIECHPKFIKPSFDELLMIFCEIMETSGLLISLRTTALSCILSLCHEHHTLIRKSKYFKSNMVPAYMRMLAQINENEIEEWGEELIDQVISKSDISMSTEEHLGQIANELGNKFMFPLFVPYITQNIKYPNMKQQHAALTALAILVQNCHESYKKEFNNMITLMMPLLQSENPRIIYDVLVAMGYLASEFAPDVQIYFGEMILQFITRALQHPMQKIQYKAALCIVNFQQGIAQNKEIKVMEPFLDTILSQLARIFEHSLMKSNYIMLEAVLQSLATIATANNFSKYYNTFMPGLTKIVSMITGDTPQKANIKNKAIQTMGDLLASIREDRQLFNPECSNIMQSLIALQSQVNSEDSIHKSIFTVYQNVVEVLGEEFSVYSDSIFNLVYEAAMRKVDVQIIDEMQTQKQQNTSGHKYVKIKLDLKIDGIKNIVLNTQTFEQKIEATNLLSAMSEYMKQSFMRYTDFMYPLIEQLIVIKNSKEMRANMIDCCKFMVVGGRTNEQKYTILTKVYMLLKKALSEAIRVKDHSEVASIMEAYSLSIPYMAAQMINGLPEMVSAVLSMIKTLTTDIQKIYADKEMDDDLNEQMGNETEEVQQPLEYIEDILRQTTNIAALQGLKKYFPKDYEFTQ